MNHKELITRADRWLLKSKGCGFTLVELNSNNNGCETPDVIGWKYAHSHLIECKSSRADFLSDKNKVARRMPERGMGNYRYYMCEPETIKPEDLPLDWGLLYVYPKHVKQIIDPKYFDNIAKNDIYILCSALRRVHIRGDLAKIYNPESIKRVD